MLQLLQTSSFRQYLEEKNVFSPMLFVLTNTISFYTAGKISFYTAGGKEKGTTLTHTRTHHSTPHIIVLSKLLSDVYHWKGKINSHSSLEKQQLGEISWEGNHCPIHTSLGAEVKACSRVHLEFLSTKTPCYIMHYKKQVSVWDREGGIDWQSIVIRRTRASAACGTLPYARFWQ